ncbi:uncharacterized protein si:ch73-52p7.1 [Thalassophryne amazonica]|uniref:uncharacterized protein si:ch73-52p7.1 n=1 Tax=Thalassophryne amazonica TaxID=390379 RepID=UPI00147146C8|nr:uncharacterized protein si:ch73-52p7.1 [Thalassophryne amazonica]
MHTFSPPAPLLCVLACVSLGLQRSDLRLAYVTHSSFYYYTCSQDLQPCTLSSLTDRNCKELQFSTLRGSSTVFRMRHLTVWYTSPSNAAHLLNNSEVRHVTLIRCGSSVAARQGSQEGHFAVQHLERLTVITLQWNNAPNGNRAKNVHPNTDPEGESSVHLDTNRYTNSRDPNLYRTTDMKTGSKAPASASSSPQVQEIFLGREYGAAYREQARLGIIHSSVLEWGAVVKSYTVQSYINRDGALPFPNLLLPRLPETTTVYVSFVYGV